ncbi:TPM domain-containing protein [Xanthomonas euvesicatoria pv. allii]|uniref:TPM domain-containing protein n=1 Tax=Xanthomonas euvesicatoria TaxID=456327 RepID=UPI0024073162|nr:TPM domain-containing protein [Xanthomonas euvesicatoria]MCP3039967.1 TPM domain-containing protein [Xanthomonas euvesicatoria pv. allii]MCP3051811.1 TPM domain-containing protein [Xanthomonas euvesicatoria pv. allii]
MRRMCLRVVWMMALLLPASLLAQELAAIPPLRSPVVDVTGTLDAAQIQQLEQQALALQQRKGAQLQILIVPTTQPEAIEQYTQRVFDQWKIGRKGVDDGVLLLVAKDDRRVRIQPGYGLEGAIPDIAANRIIQEYLAPRFREGDYAGGITAATATLAGLIEGEALPAPVSGHAEGGNGAGGGGWIMALFIGFVVAMVARGILGALPRPLRAVLTGVAAGGAALLLTSLLLASAGAALIGLLAGLSSGSPGRFVGGGGWGGGFGGFGGGGRGGFGGGGGWGGGGGSSGGGGASGSW